MDNAFNIAKNMNTLAHLESLLIPILDGFTEEQQNLTDPNHRIVFTATKNNTVELFAADGVLDDNESFGERINKVVRQINEEVKTNELYKEDRKYLVYYKDYTSSFNYKIYIQDILTGSKDDLKFIRQLSAYFVEPQTREFYQISMSAGSYSVNKGYKLLRDIENYEEDEIVKGLEKDLTLIMDNIVYR